MNSPAVPMTNCLVFPSLFLTCFCFVFVYFSQGSKSAQLLDQLYLITAEDHEIVIPGKISHNRHPILHATIYPALHTANCMFVQCLGVVG